MVRQRPKDRMLENCNLDDPRRSPGSGSSTTLVGGRAELGEIKRGVASAILVILFLAISIHPSLASDNRLRRQTHLRGYAAAAGTSDSGTSKSMQGQADSEGGVDTLQAGASQMHAGVDSSGAIKKLFPSIDDTRATLPSGASQTVLSSGTELDKTEMKVLASRDVYLFVDKSWSMGTRDCPGISGVAPNRESLRGMIDEFVSGDPNAITRWQWCGAQAVDLANAVHRVSPSGYTLVLFDQSKQVFRRADARLTANIFARSKTDGKTKLTEALGEQISEWLKSPRTKPLSIAVITDGLPDSPESLTQLLIDTSKSARNPKDISITFLQVGSSAKGRDFLQVLDDQLVRQGAKHDIVDTQSFLELQNLGLARAIVDAVRETSSR